MCCPTGMASLFFNPCVGMWVHMCICMLACTCIEKHVPLLACMCVCVRKCMHACLDIHLQTRILHYPMTSVEISGERGFWEMFPNMQWPSLPWVMGQKQEPIAIEKLHNSRWGNCRGSRNHSACGLVVPGPRQLPHRELCNFSMSMGTCQCAAWLQGGGGCRVMKYEDEFCD